MRQAIFFIVVIVCIAGSPIRVGGQALQMPVMSELEGKIRTSGFAKDDSLEMMLMRMILKKDSTDQLGITEEQERAIYMLNQKLSVWCLEEVKRQEKRHGRNQSDEAFLKQIQHDVNKAVMEQWIGELTDSVLLPFQVERLKATCVANLRARLGDKEFFSLPWLRKELEIDDEQLSRIKNRIDMETAKLDEESKKLMEQLEKLKTDATNGILSELNSDQREKALSLFPGIRELDKDKSPPNVNTR